MPIILIDSKISGRLQAYLFPHRFQSAAGTMMKLCIFSTGGAAGGLVLEHGLLSYEECPFVILHLMEIQEEDLIKPEMATC